MTKLKWFILALRVTMEAAIVAALAVWGYHVGPDTISKLALALAAPAAGFSLVYHGLVYLDGGRLLKTPPVPGRGSQAGPATRISPSAIVSSAREGGPR